MFSFNKNSEKFYLNYVDTELYKSKFTLTRSVNVSKLIFIDNINKSSYWFPTLSGLSSPWGSEVKLKNKKQFLKNSIYSYDSFSFVSSFEIFLNSKFGPSSSILKSNIFLNYVSTINELVRKQELKKNVQNTKMYSVTSWKYQQLTNYALLKYYYNFEPHRNLIRIRRFNFLAIYTWIPSKRWLFGYRNMRNFYFKWRKIQKFEFKFFRAPGMSFSYWAKQQLQYNYFNVNSSDVLSDSYTSNIFMPSQIKIDQSEQSYLFASDNYDFLHYNFVYWLLTQIKINYNKNGHISHFSNSYISNQVSNSTKHKYLKNFFSYTTPKYAHAFYNKLNDSYGGWSELRNYFSFFKPSYWNLKRGLDFHPHEHWSWEDVLWWEDHVPLFFSRFSQKRREEQFFGLDNIDSSNFVWFYKSWFHEEIYGELSSSYYRTYYNSDYLTPGWRISTDFPKKKMGHFDPKWTERLQEYVIYPYMDLFYPSTKRYYINYSSTPPYVDSASFIALNFSWKLNTLSPFHYKFRSKFRKVLRSTLELKTQLDNLKPCFFEVSNNLNFIYFFPTSLLNSKTWLVLNKYLNSLVFLVNVFTKSPNQIDLIEQNLNYLFYYLNSLCLLKTTRKGFLEIIIKKQPASYAGLLNYLEKTFFLSPNDVNFYKERIIAEYIAFKRFYSKLLSEYNNIYRL